ncbi:MAG: hypothetical protein Q7T53_00740 [Deltaproteobacteria bacterium]|nr:hypothetical protein [Deltaproteobacteria bacterium]
MAQLHYHRWQNEFEKADFSSESSMRDYLFRHPQIIVNKDTDVDAIIPIGEEESLPESGLSSKNKGRADIVIVKVYKNDGNDVAGKNNKLLKENIEIWICELKKVEATYYNGLEQLLDYMSTFQKVDDLKNKIGDYIINWYRKNRKQEIEFEGESSFIVCGSLVAPSFDLYSTMKKAEINNNENWPFKNILEKLPESFTMFDIVRKAEETFGFITLNKVMRFIRSDEEIIFSENALGEAASKAQHIKRIDPLEIFKAGILKESDRFYFRDMNGREHREVQCTVEKTRGRSHSFVVKVSSVDDHNQIEIPKWAKTHFDFSKNPLPYIGTAKICSLALHKMLKVIIDNETLYANYGAAGDNNFIREGDRKSLAELREELRR